MDEVIIIDIQDDGVGFDPNVVAARNGASGLGLRSMRERAAELGGRCAVESAPGEGTTIMVELPARVEPAAEAPR